MNEFVESQRALGPQIRVQDLWEMSWRSEETHTDPMLQMPCFIYDTVARLYWFTPDNGWADDESQASVWTPEQFFARNYGGDARRRNVFCFLEGQPIADYPKPERVYGGDLQGARGFLHDHPDRLFLVQGYTTHRYLNHLVFAGAGSAQYLVAHRILADLFEAAEINHPRWDGLKVNYEIMPEGYVRPPRPKIELRHILTAKMIESLETMPDNPIVRTQVWSLLKAPIPEDKKTFEEIKTWIEENYDPKRVGSFRGPPPDDPFDVITAAQAPAPITDAGFRIRVDTRRPVYGTCHYSAVERGSATYDVRREDIEAAARNAISYPNFRDAIILIIQSAVVEEPPEDSDETDYEYQDHQQEDAVGAIHVDIATDPGVQALEWLRRYHPDLAEALDPGGMEDAGNFEEDEPDEEDRENQ